MRNLLDLFHRNPRLLVLTIALISVAGLSSFYVLPRMEDPVLRDRVAQVHTRFPGASPERVEALVTEKLEEELKEIEEIKSVRSVSRTGASTLTIELADEVVDVDDVWSRIRDKLDDAAVLLPPEAHEPDIEVVKLKAYAMIVAVKWTSPQPVSNAVLRRTAKDLADRLRSVSGTDVVDEFGDPQEEVTVEVIAEKLASLGLTVGDVADQIRASDAKVAAGQLRGDAHDLLLEVDGELDSLTRLARTPIRFGGDGRFVLLEDVADLKKGIADPPNKKALINGELAIVMGALVQEQRRIDHWTEEALAELNQFREQLPAGLEVEVVFQQETYVNDRLSGLLVNLAIGAMAVTCVIFLLMGWRSALVVGAALPLSALMVLTGLRLLGIPLHQMSVTGLIIALGLLIDNAIVVVDEVRKRLGDGHPAGEAIQRTIRHLAIPLLGSTLTTALAFAPLATMAGPAGEFVGSIGVSVILAVFSSLFLSMTVIPALVVMGVRIQDAWDSLPWWKSGFRSHRLNQFYRRSLDTMFARPFLGILVGISLPIIGLTQASKLSEQFFPLADRDQIQVLLELPAVSSIRETEAQARQARELILKHPEVESVDWYLGESAPPFYYNLVLLRQDMSHFGQALIQLKSKHGAQSLIHQLQAELEQAFPSSQILVRQLEQGPPIQAPIEVRLFGPDTDRLRQLGQQVRHVLSETPNVVQTKSDLAEAAPKVAFVVDEQQARLAGLDHSAIARQLDRTLEGAVGGSILESTEELPVRVRLPQSQRGSVQEIASLDLLGRQASSPQSPRIPLTAVADLQVVPNDSSIIRFNGERMNEIQAHIHAGVLASDVLADFRARLAAADFELPPGYSLRYAGEAEQRDMAVGNLMANVGVLVVLMGATLVLSFGSFRMAGMIASVGLLSVGLGMAALWMFDYPFGFMAIVGTMGLIGVAINDSIVVLAAIREDPRASIGDRSAMAHVVFRASRHVIATTLTTIAGFMPLILSGGGFWPPMAIAIAGGVGGATLLALYFVPATYLLIIQFGQRRTTDVQTLPAAENRVTEIVPSEPSVVVS